MLVTPGGDWPTALRRLGDAGAQALRQWVRAGGRYVGYRGGGAKLAQALGLTTAQMRDPIADVPGSVVRVELDRDHPLADSIGRWCWILFDDDDVVTEYTRGTARCASPEDRATASTSPGWPTASDSSSVPQRSSTSRREADAWC